MRLGRWIETKNASGRIVKADLKGSNLFGTREVQWCKSGVGRAVGFVAGVTVDCVGRRTEAMH